MKTARGLHLWKASFTLYDPKLYITTRLRAPLVAVKRAQQAGKEAGYRGLFAGIEYMGTIDA